jgi:hypothetical protein
MARERGADPLQTTALINDLYLKMVDLKRVNRQNRAHFSRFARGRCGAF